MFILGYRSSSTASKPNDPTEFNQYMHGSPADTGKLSPTMHFPLCDCHLHYDQNAIYEIRITLFTHSADLTRELVMHVIMKNLSIIM